MDEDTDLKSVGCKSLGGSIPLLPQDYKESKTDRVSVTTC